MLEALGPVRVDSHTASVKVDFLDPGSLGRAVLTLGGAWLGQGSHHLYAGNVVGYGFTLPGWQFALVLQNGQLLYDDYGGNWGKVSDLDALKDAYAIEAMLARATALGWLAERTESGLTVYHPEGGILTYTKGQIETTGFVGTGCHEAREALNLEKLGLHASDVQLKPEYGQVAAKVQLPS